MSTDHTPICVTDDHDYTIINIRQMNGHQTPLIKCERCDTVWHNHTPAQRGDLIFIPTRTSPTTPQGTTEPHRQEPSAQPRQPAVATRPSSTRVLFAAAGTYENF